MAPIKTLLLRLENGKTVRVNEGDEVKYPGATLIDEPEGEPQAVDENSQELRDALTKAVAKCDHLDAMLDAAGYAAKESAARIEELIEALEKANARIAELESGAGEAEVASDEPAGAQAG